MGIATHCRKTQLAPGGLAAPDIAIIREHKFRPLPKTVHLIGRQTVQLSHRQMIEILHKHGLTPAPVPIDIDHCASRTSRGADGTHRIYTSTGTA
jgi:hypothetical protein